MDNREIAFIEDCQKGNKENFAYLYDMYSEKIYNYIFSKTFDREMAEDLTSETFFKALDKIKSFKMGEKASFQAWIYRIAHNKIIDFYRKKKEDVTLEDYLDIKVEEIDFGANFDNKQKLKEVFKYFNTLKTEQRDILIMRIWDGLSYKEISQISGKSVSNCKKIVSRTLSKVNGDIVLALLLLAKFF
ncbi:MAG: RNA polymerase sigma factor [Candidatus Gracilibacteria bacterium]|nr:RNA polymerase sigma factor [Candidatus Gracilibacteria bacterium]